MHPGMALQPAGRHRILQAQQGRAQDLRFGGTGDDQMDFVGREDVVETKGDRPRRNGSGIVPEGSGLQPRLAARSPHGKPRRRRKAVR